MSSKERARQFDLSTSRVAVMGARCVLCAAGLVAALDVAAEQAVTAPADVNVLGSIIVTARNREEVAQDVPVPVSIVGGQTLERDDVVSVWGLTQKVPNLLISGGNPRQTSISLRGIGKNSAQDSMEPSVGIIVDGVANSYVGQSWSDYVDLDRIEVIRGPQGTLLGKNTTLGVINIVTKTPSFEPGYTFEARAGSRNLLEGKFSATGGIIDGLLAYRGSFFVNRSDGFFDNTWQTGESWNEKNRIGGRVQFLLTPSTDVTARIIVDKLRSTERVNLSLLLEEPESFPDGSSRTSGNRLTYSKRLARSYFGGYTPTFGTDTLENAEARPQETSQSGISAQIDWQLGDYTLTSISAHRKQDFDIKNGGNTRFYINNGGQQLWNEQYTQELRLSSPVGKAIDYQVGLFGLNAKVYSDDPSYFGEDAGAFYATNAQYNTLWATGMGRELLRDSLKGFYYSKVLEPKTDSVAAFGQLNWHLTEAATLTVGARDTYEHKTNRQRYELDRPGVSLAAANYPGATPAEVAAAQAIRDGRRSLFYDWVNGESINENSVSWLISPNYKLTPDMLLYVSASYGEKSGAVEFNNDGSSRNVDPEKALDYELGVKSQWFSHRLLLNLNLYQTKLTDYQSNLAVIDPDDPTGATILNYLGNIPGVRARGVELETNYAITSALNVNFNGSYNRAIYTEWKSAPCADTVAAEICDFSGRQLHSAPKVTANIGVDYTIPAFGYQVHLYATNTYRSGSYLAPTQSVYTWQKAYNITDGGIGVGTEDGKYELSLTAKNVFDESYAISRGSFSSSGPVTWTPGDGRLYAFVFRAKL